MLACTRALWDVCSSAASLILGKWRPSTQETKQNSQRDKVEVLMHNPVHMHPWDALSLYKS
jgi:hypothetical protein